MEFVLIILVLALIISLYFNFKTIDEKNLIIKYKESAQNEISKLKLEAVKSKEEYEKLINSKKGITTSPKPVSVAKHNGGRRRF